MALLGLLPCSVLVCSLAALLAVVDVRTGGGYVLCILSSLHLAITIVVVVTITVLAQVQPRPINRHNGSVAILLFFYFAPAVYAMLVTLIGAAIVAGIAHHWRWIPGFVVAAVGPFLVAALPYSFPYSFWGPNTEYIVRQLGFLGVLVAPEATILAYSITRLVHPVMPARARQLAPLN